MTRLAGDQPAPDLALRDDPANARLETRFEVPRLRSFGDLVHRSLRLWRDCFEPILLVSLVLVVPLDVVVSLCDAFTVGDDWLEVCSHLASLVQRITLAYATPAIIYAMIIRLRDGRVAGVGEALAWGGKAGLRTLGFRILLGLLTVVGLLALIIPALLFMVWYSLIDVVVAAEGRRHPGVFARSKALTEGSRWWIFFCYVLFVGAIFLVSVVAGLVNYAVWFSADSVWSIHGVLSFGFGVVFMVAMTLMIWLLTAMQVTVYMDGVGTHLRQCPGCGYDLTGNVSGACPECGAAIPQPVREHLAALPTVPRV